MTSFADFSLLPPIQKALDALDYTRPTPIQQQAIPLALDGRDILGIAQTGTGKTAAFSLPILHRLGKNGGKRNPKTCRALILSPTRELAGQIFDSVRDYSKFLHLSVGVVYGGVSIGQQIRRLVPGLDVLVATPGRLLDLIEQRALTLDGVEVLVLDEADQMMDLGFIVPLKRIQAMLPKERQSLFFSATMPKTIASMAESFLRNPVTVAVAQVATTAERVEQGVMFLSGQAKIRTLQAILGQPEFERTMVFTRTKRGADKVTRSLELSGIRAVALHGNKTQGQRQRALKDFKDGECPVLVATDIAARGIDVSGVSHVVNYDIPNIAESYVHRIGRTARAGAAGQAISFCSTEDRAFLRDIEKLIRQKIPVLQPPASVSFDPVQTDRAFDEPMLDDGDDAGDFDARPQARKPNRAQRPAVKPRSHGQNVNGQGQNRGNASRDSDRTQAERPARADRPFGERGNRAFADRAPADRHHADRPHGARTEGGRVEAPRGEKPGEAGKGKPFSGRRSSGNGNTGSGNSGNGQGQNRKSSGPRTGGGQGQRSGSGQYRGQGRATSGN